ncbi:MAG TPA: flagellar biosynthetic protein FliR [Solirubrobacteraceae bacterium]|nr:flagellar biosynthetic protein FliR [Solirubrobacteraceae bacterium]
MQTLLAKLSGGELLGFILVLARIGPLFLIAPVFSAQALPARVKTVAAAGISIGLTPVALHGQQLPGGALAIGELIVESLLCGLAFAFTLAVLFAAVESAGAFVDFTTGLSFGRTVNPALGNEGGSMSLLYGIIGLLVFIVIGGIEWMVRGIARTFTLVPLTRAPRLGSLVGGAESAFATVFTAALEICAPVIIAMAITDVAFGVLARVVPQMNVFAVGFPLKILIGVLLVGATLPFLGSWISEALTQSVASALATLHVA